MIKKLVTFISIAMLSFQVQAESFVEGKDYVVLKNQTTQSTASNKVKVTDFFSYGCPWCFKLDKPLDSWAEKNQNQVALQKVPVVFNKSWLIYAKAYYTINALAPTQNIDDSLFEAIIDKNQKLSTPEEMATFLAQHGIKEESAQNALTHSPSIDLQIQNDRQLMVSYQITAIPAVVIDNKYKTDLQMAQNKERFFAILDFLVEKASKSEQEN